MQDPVTGSKLVTINLPDGSERNLKKCSPSDWYRLANSFRNARKAAKKANLVGAPPAEIVAELDKFDKQPLKMADVDAWLNEPDGQIAAILLALAKDNPAADADQLLEEFDKLALEPQSWPGIAWKLFNIPTEPAKPTKPGSGAPEKKDGGGTAEAPTTLAEQPESFGTSTPAPATP